MAIYFSSSMRDVLVEHIDGPVPLIMHDNGSKIQTTRAMILRGWLRPDRDVRPRTTRLTDEGRKVLCRALGEWADALSKVDLSRLDIPEVNTAPVILPGVWPLSPTTEARL